MSLSEKDRALVRRVFAIDLPYTCLDGMILSEEMVGRLLQAAREEASQGAGEPVAWRVKDFADGWFFYGKERGAEAMRAQVDGFLVQPLFTSPPPDPRTKALEEAVNKAIRILSDHKLGEPRRVLDARDVLIIARAALNQGADHD